MTSSRESEWNTLSRLPGMDAARAAALLRHLPLLGRAPTSLLLTLADLEPPGRRGRQTLRTKDVYAIQSILMTAYLIARRDRETRLGILLRRLREAHPDEHPQLCLAAMLRYYNYALRRLKKGRG